MSQPLSEGNAGAAPVIRLEGVSKVFRAGSGPATVLNDVSLSVQPGEIFGIIGARAPGSRRSCAA